MSTFVDDSRELSITLTLKDPLLRLVWLCVYLLDLFILHVYRAVYIKHKNRGRPNFGFDFGAECGQMGTFGGHSVSAESSCTTFGTLSVRHAAVGKFGGCRK